MCSASAIVRCCSDATSTCRSSAPGNALTRRLRPLNAISQTGELLARIVVEIARDARPLDLLSRDQASGQILNLSIACLQDGFVLANRLFDLLPFGDIHLRPDHAMRRAIRTSDQGSA